MAKSRRTEPRWRAISEGEGFIQPRQSRKARIEATAAKRWAKERQLLRQNVWFEEEIDFEEDGE